MRPTDGGEEDKGEEKVVMGGPKFESSSMFKVVNGRGLEEDFDEDENEDEGKINGPTSSSWLPLLP